MATITTTELQKKKIASTQYPIIDLLKSRWSPREFSNKDVPESELMQLFEAARWSASSNNYQPWRFIYAHKGEEAYERIFKHLAEFNQGWVKNAPVLMLTLYKEQFDNGKENFHASHDLGMCLGNMAIQAESMGIAVHHMAGVNWKEATKEFSVPEGYHVTTAVAIGYYGGDLDNLSEDLREAEVKKRERNPVEDFAFKGEWK